MAAAADWSEHFIALLYWNTMFSTLKVAPIGTLARTRVALFAPKDGGVQHVRKPNLWGNAQSRLACRSCQNDLDPGDPGEIRGEIRRDPERSGEIRDSHHNS